MKSDTGSGGDLTASNEHKPLPTTSTEKFIEIEDRLAQSLTSDQIRVKSAGLFNQIRESIKQSDFDTTKFMALELKQLNRLSNFRNQRLKNELQTLQSSSDSVYLSYNNLADEISHIRKSIAACLDFRSADQDLELVSIEEFFDKGAQEIGFDLAQKDDEHQLRIGRLNFELAQRNAMNDSLREREDLKNLLTSDIKGKINRLAQIRPLIGSIRDSAKPLMEILNLQKIAEGESELSTNDKFEKHALNELPESDNKVGADNDKQIKEETYERMDTKTTI